MKTRIFVPSWDEARVQALGAKYDGRMKSWYVPENVFISAFNRYVPLSIELIPSSNWAVNVRSEMKNEWDNLKRDCYHEANYQCSVCGGKGEEHPVECHEKWSYDMETGIQKLERLIALCPTCHLTKHWGKALLDHKEDIVKKHILQVNHWKEKDLNKYLQEVFFIFDLRSKIQWTLDLSLVRRG